MLIRAGSKVGPGLRRDDGCGVSGNESTSRYEMTRLLLLLATLVAALPAHADEWLVHAGKLVDVDAGTVLTDQAVRIDGARIVAVEPWRDGLAEGRRVLDWSEHTVLPGLMDMHTHLAD